MKDEEKKPDETKPEDPKAEEPKTEETKPTITNTFTDVSEKNWYYEDVLRAVELGLVNGKSDTSFDPDDNLTYAEAVKLAACMHQLYTTGKVTLENGNPWYQTYVDYCFDNNIINTEYNYSDFATRAGYMVIFANALPEEALEKINNVPDDSIPDVPSSRAYAPAVYKLYRAGILQGSDDAHSCKPVDNIRRSEVAAILSRMMDETKRVKFNMGAEEETEEPKEEVKPLAIKTQPVDVSVKVGETATLTVEASGGKAPYTYQWQSTAGKNFITLIDSSTVSGSRTATLSCTKTAEYSGEFKCVITDADGNKVTSETVTIEFTPKSSLGERPGTSRPTGTSTESGSSSLGERPGTSRPTTSKPTT